MSDLFFKSIFQIIYFLRHKRNMSVREKSEKFFISQFTIEALNMILLYLLVSKL